jgi:hypothetical protein
MADLMAIYGISPPFFIIRVVREIRSSICSFNLFLRPQQKNLQKTACKQH